jgi:hypothetical protein
MATLKFRVLLDTEKESEIFRDILINDDDNFESLYHAIINSFRFEGNQMASFYLSNDDWDKGHEISLMDVSYGDEDIDEKTSVMSNTKLKELIVRKNQKIILVYDFLRMWIFLIELIEITTKFQENPETVFSIGMAPPEDSKMANLEEEEEEMYSDEFDDLDDEFDEDFEDGYDDEDYKNFEEY